MESLSALENLDENISQIKIYAQEYNDFMSKKRIDTIEKNIAEIKDIFKIDYTKPLKMSKKEAEELRRLILDFVRTKKDNFNTHYIQLLAWHLHELDVLPVKKHGVVRNVTFLEYAPSSLIPITATNRIFSLFLPRRIETEKVSTALVLNYLNNYEHASQRYMNVLNSYLKRIHFSKNTDVYFNFNNVVNYIEKKTPSSKLNYFERLKTMGIRENTIETKYFINALKGYRGYEY
jgi:hypothetical protein